MLLVHQLCSIIQPNEVPLVKGYSQFLTILIKQGIKLQGKTFTACKRWILESLEFSQPAAAADLLTALQSLLITGPFNSIIQVNFYYCYLIDVCLYRYITVIIYIIYISRISGN